MTTTPVAGIEEPEMTDDNAPEIMIVNFSHPLTATQLASIAELAGVARSRVRVLDVPTHFNKQEPLASQVVGLVRSVGFSSEDWQSSEQRMVVVNVPGYAPAAAILLAELHGLTGHFPSILHIREAAARPGTIYEVAEIINLTALRLDEARQRRNDPARANPG